MNITTTFYLSEAFGGVFVHVVELCEDGFPQAIKYFF